MRGRGVPRGPPEWGEMLYEPEWASKRRYGSPSSFGFGLFLMGATAPLFALLYLIVSTGGLALWNYDSLRGALAALGIFIFILLVALVMLWLGLVLGFASELETMPFRMYTEGFTKTDVPLRQGIRRLETLVTWDRLESVKVTEASNAGRSIRLDFKDEKGATEHQYVHEEDRHGVLLLLSSIIPDRIDASAMPYIAKGPGRLPGVPSMVRKRPFLLMWLLLPFFLWLLVLMVPFFGGEIRRYWMDGGVDEFMLGAAVVVTVMLSGALLEFGYILSKGHYLWAVFSRSQLARDRLVLPSRGPARVMIRARRDIPISEIVEVRRFLESQSMSQLAKLRTVTGEELELRPQLLEAFARHPDFEMGDHVAVNTGVLEVHGERVIRPKYERAVAIAVVPMAVLLFIIYGPEVKALEDWDFLVGVSMLLMQMFVLFLVVLLVVFVRSWRLWMRRARGLEVTRTGMSYPSLLGPRRSIRRGRILDVNVRNTYLLGYHVSVRTGMSRISFPLDVHDRFEGAGFTIEDPEGVLEGL